MVTVVSGYEVGVGVLLDRRRTGGTAVRASSCVCVCVCVCVVLYGASLSLVVGGARGVVVMFVVNMG